MQGCTLAGDYAETNQTVLKLPEDVGGDALELLLHGVYLHEVWPIAETGFSLLLLCSHAAISLYVYIRHQTVDAERRLMSSLASVMLKPALPHIGSFPHCHILMSEAPMPIRLTRK